MKDIPFNTNISPLDIYCAGSGCEIFPFVHGHFLQSPFSFFLYALIKIHITPQFSSIEKNPKPTAFFL